MNRNKIAEASETAQRRPANLTRPGRSASGRALKIRALSEPRLTASGRIDKPLRKLRFRNAPWANEQSRPSREPASQPAPSLGTDEMGRKAGIAARRKPCARCGRFALPEGGRSRRQHTTLKIVRYDPRR